MSKMYLVLKEQMLGLLLSMIKLRATSLKFSGDTTLVSGDITFHLTGLT